MKKILIAITVISLALNVFGQGTIIFENVLGNGVVSLYGTPLQPGTYTVALFFSPSTSGNVPLNEMQEIAFYFPGSENGEVAGKFYDPETIVTPSGSGSATFAVAAWQGNYDNLYTAEAFGGIVGFSSEFVNEMGTPPDSGLSPPDILIPVLLSGSGGAWDGNVDLAIPEPSSIGLCGLGLAVFLFSRRGKESKAH